MLKHVKPAFLRGRRIFSLFTEWQLLLPLACLLKPNVTEQEFVNFLHTHLLRVTLRRIRDPRVGDREREECLQWVFGKTDAPFSCAACCKIEGLNINDVRDAVKLKLGQLREIHLHELTQPHESRVA